MLHNMGILPNVTDELMTINQYSQLNTTNLHKNNTFTMKLKSVLL